MGLFDNYKVRPSSLYRIMADTAGITPTMEAKLAKLEQREIEAKDGVQKPLTDNMVKEMNELRARRDKKPELSAGAKTYALEVYAEVKYGIVKTISSVHIEKGLMVEEDTISLLSMLDNRLYTKNEKRKESEYLSGCPDWGVDHPDIDKATIVDDAKSSWDLLTFLASKYGNLSTQYEWQGLGYMEIWPNIKEWRVRHGLVNTPQIILEQEKSKIRYKLGIVDGVGDDRVHVAYNHAAEEIDRLGSYDHLPIEERTATKVVKRDEDKIALIPQQVKLFREYLNWLDTHHANG